MLDDHVQQWSAVQTVRAAGLTIDDVLHEYSEAGGGADEMDVRGYLAGLTTAPTAERDLLAQAINELLDLNGLWADGAHYSADDVASRSGYAEYLRILVLSPDAYDFAADTPDDVWDDAEARRCNAVYESGMLDSGAESRFDRITACARDHFEVSSASIALITEDRQIIKSVSGSIGQDLPRYQALCARTIEASRTLVINDAQADPAWRDHPLVTGPSRVRFYAGQPLTSVDGWRIGSLCVMDDEPRGFTANDRLVLLALAQEVQTEMWPGHHGNSR